MLCIKSAMCQLLFQILMSVLTQITETASKYARTALEAIPVTVSWATGCLLIDTLVKVCFPWKAVT